MTKGYMFYDDETANSDQRICSLAYVLYDNDGNKLDEINELIDPESEINFWNHRIHGISDADVAGKQTMREFCENSDFLEQLTDYVFVAHNAKGADLHHIRKSFATYDIAMPEVQYIDTKVFASNTINIGSLPDLCAHFSIDLKHHDALEDALACRQVFLKLSEDYGLPEAEVWGSERSSRPSRRGRVRPIGSLGFVNGSDQTIEEALCELAEQGLRGDPTKLETIEGVHFTVTGGVPGYNNRDIAKEELKAKGAKVAGIGNATQWLIIGDNAGQKKIDEAIEKEIPVLSSFELLDILERF